jgi:hypothetical protein
VDVDQVSSQELEDSLNSLENGRQPQLFGNGRQPHFLAKWKTTSIFFWQMEDGTLSFWAKWKTASNVR